MNQETYFKPSRKNLIIMQVVHFGNILFNLQFIPLFIMLASILSFLVPLIFYLFLLSVSLLTLFSIYAVYPQFASWWSGGEKITEVVVILASSWKYTVPIALGFSLFSILCLAFDRPQRHYFKIAVSVIIALTAVFVLILKFINGGAV